MANSRIGGRKDKDERGTSCYVLKGKEVFKTKKWRVGGGFQNTGLNFKGIPLVKAEQFEH